MKVDATRFKSALTHLKKTGTSGNSTLPALNQVHVQWGGTVLAMTSNDLELQLTTVMGTEVQDTEGELTIPWAQLLAATEGKMTGKEVTITETDDGTSVQVGRKQIVKKNDIDSDLPMVEYELHREGEFSDPRWHKVVAAAAKDDSRPVLAGIHILTDNDGTLWMEAADGFRMGRISGSKTQAEADMIVPRRALDNVPKGNPLALYGGTSIEHNDYAIIGYTITHDIQVIACVRTIEGQFPDLSQIEPKPEDRDHLITVRSSDVIEASRHALKYGKDNRAGIVQFNSEGILAPSSEVGNAVFNGYELQISEEYALNGEYLIWAADGDDELGIYLGQPAQAALVVDGPLTMTIMPMLTTRN